MGRWPGPAHRELLVSWRPGFQRGLLEEGIDAEIGRIRADRWGRVGKGLLEDPAPAGAQR